MQLKEIIYRIKCELESLASYQAWAAEHNMPLNEDIEDRMVEYKEELLNLLNLIPELAQAEVTEIFEEGDLEGISFLKPIYKAEYRPYIATVASCIRYPYCLKDNKGELFVEIKILRKTYFLKLTDFIPAQLPAMVLVGVEGENLIFVRADEEKTYRLAATSEAVGKEERNEQ